jgi:hypothetical protein
MVQQLLQRIDSNSLLAMRFWQAPIQPTVDKAPFFAAMQHIAIG